MNLKFSKSAETIITSGRIITAWSKVRNELNRQRGAGEVVMTEPEEHPYYPREFPNGIWNVFAPLPRSIPYLSPFFIPTDAWQMVDTWETVNGMYTKKTGKQYRDSGYGLHFSISSTTLGCIRIKEKAALEWLATEVAKAISKKESVTLEVVS